MPYTVVLDPLKEEEEKKTWKRKLSKSCKIYFRIENSRQSEF